MTSECPNDANDRRDAKARLDPETEFGSNAVRLTPRQCAVAALLLLVLFKLIPAVWQRIEPLDAGPDYRVPFSLGNDYWHYARTARELAVEDKTVLLGDSVIWGHYVRSDQTLSHYLNAAAGGERFVNLGVDGIHPVALAGLVEFYGGALRNRRVVLNCNLLWMSSRRHDLSEDKEFAFNHPGLVPQFSPWLRCYKEPLSGRIGNVVGRNVDFLGWAAHLRFAYFHRDDVPQDVPSWTIEHPYENPLAAVTFELPSPDEPPSPAPDARPWSAKGIAPVTPEWVALDESLQWRFFRQTVERLRERGNQVFVLVGPMNEPMLTEKGLAAYRGRQKQVAAWLDSEGIPHYVPPPLASEHYADLSHPTAEGYKVLAGRLWEQKGFGEFVQGGEVDR